MDIMLKEAKRLHRLGFAIHWIKPNSKIPLESGWTKGPRKNLNELEESHRYGFNIGVRLGDASRFQDGSFLAVIDGDVKSQDLKHEKEMRAKLKELIGSNTCPIVMSGRGNGSCHAYIRTQDHTIGGTFAKSKEKVKVHMPSSKPSKNELETLSTDELNEGLRLRPAWEISILCEGRQVVLPPSIHPDSGGTYEWATPIEKWQDIPILKLDSKSTLTEKSEEKTVIEDFKIEEVDLFDSDISSESYDAIISGKGVEDRSAALFKVCIELIRLGFTDNQILSILTEPKYFLSQAAYDHAKTENRKRAALWLKKYTLQKVKREHSAEAAFDGVTDLPPLSDEQAEIQKKEIIESEDWKNKIARRENDRVPKSTLENIVLILQNALRKDVVKRDEFSIRDFYTCNTPWGGKKGEVVSDDDAPGIALWLSRTFRFEPSKDKIFDALTVIACENKFHPVKEELEALPEWDLTPRLDTWLADYFNAQGDGEYLAQVFRKWMLAAATRIYRPGAKFDWLPIFEGTQGIGKSSFGRILVGDQYFLDWLPDLSDKDAALSLQGIWAVELGELATLRKNQIEIVKAFVTRTVDKVRPPYGRKKLEIHRQCVFYGTTNRDTYLQDETGNRRFKPVQVGKLNFKKLQADRDQLWAEALVIFHNDFEKTLELENDAVIFEKEIQKDKMVEDESSVMQDQLEAFFSEQKSRPKNERQIDLSKFKISTLFEQPFGVFRVQGCSGRTMQLAAQALRGLGVLRKTVNGQRYWSFEK